MAPTASRARGRNARLVGRRAGDVGEALVGYEGLRSRVGDDVGDLRRAEPVVDRHVVPAGLERSEVDLDGPHAVRQQHRHAVAVAHAEATQRVHDAVAAVEQLAGGVLGAVRIDDRDR